MAYEREYPVLIFIYLWKNYSGYFCLPWTIMSIFLRAICLFWSWLHSSIKNKPTTSPILAILLHNLQMICLYLAHSEETNNLSGILSTIPSIWEPMSYFVVIYSYGRTNYCRLHRTMTIFLRFRLLKNCLSNSYSYFCFIPLRTFSSCSRDTHSRLPKFIIF